MSRGGNPDDRDELIQRYMDGELPEEERIRVEKLLAEDPSLRGSLEQYRLLGRLLSEAVSMKEVEADLDARFGAIVVGAGEQNVVPLRERLTVVLDEFFMHRKRLWMPAAATLVAAVSTLALVLALKGAHEAPPRTTDEGWSRVTSVSLGASSSMVMEMEDEEGTKATVLWVLGDSEEVEEVEGPPSDQGPPPDAESDSDKE
jgi:anti-sigma factor RsiW